METDVYPSIDELLPEYISRRLSVLLLHDIKERYALLGPKYVGKLMTDDGRRVNTCMEKNSAQDALEEIIDAAFNVCVLLFKGQYARSSYGLLRELNQMYDELSKMRDQIEVGGK